MSTSSSRPPRALLSAIAVSLALSSQVSVAFADPLKSFNIEDENLATALNQFAAQSDRQILFSTEAVNAKRSQLWA